MVHALVTARGCEILTVVNFIPGFNEQCELYHYINKLLRVNIIFIISLNDHLFSVFFYMLF